MFPRRACTCLPKISQVTPTVAPKHGFDSAAPDLPGLADSFRRVLRGTGVPDTGFTPWARSESAFRAGDVTNGKQFWIEEIIPGSGCSDQQAKLLISILDGVDVHAFMQAFEGTYQGKRYNSAQPAHFRQDSAVPKGDDAAFIDAQLDKLLAVGAIEETTSPSKVTMPVFVVRNGMGKPRLVHDSRFLNLWMKDCPLKYQTLRQFERGLQQGSLLWKCDHRQGYLHVPMHPDSRDYLGLEWRGRFFRYCSLPFGFSPACFVYDALSSTLAAYLRKQGVHNLAYIDDAGFSLPKGTPQAEVDRVVWLVTAALYLAGFTLALDKCCLRPSTRMELLGFIIDTERMQYEVPAPKLQRILALLSECATRTSLPVHTLQSLVGKVQALALAVPGVSTYLCASYSALARAAAVHSLSVTVSEEMREDFVDLQQLQDWSRFSSWRKEEHCELKLREFKLDTDASGGAGGAGGGWGGVVYQPDGVISTVGGKFEGALANLSIHLKEALAIPLALAQLGRSIRDCTLLLATDNEIVRFTLLRGSPDAGIMRSLARHLWRWQLQNNVHIRVRRVSTLDNVVADTLSRTGERAPRLPADFWLGWALFSTLQGWYSRSFTIDACASSLNHKLPCFLAEEHGGLALGAAGLNVFMHAFLPTVLGPHFVYCFPPSAIISPLWRHMRECGVSGVMLLPDDPRQQWYGAVLQSALSIRLLAPAGSITAISRGGVHTVSLQFAMLAAEFGPLGSPSTAVAASSWTGSR
jgi:hypothetical protein